MASILVVDLKILRDFFNANCLKLTFILLYFSLKGLHANHGRQCLEARLRKVSNTVVYSLVWLHSYSCPDLLGFCARMHSTCSLLYSCLFPFSPLFAHLATASAIPISCVLCVRVCVPRTYTINTSDKYFDEPAAYHLIISKATKRKLYRGLGLGAREKEKRTGRKEI